MHARRSRSRRATIAYRELGEGEPIVFVHGLLVDGRLWDGVAERLADALPLPRRRLADGLPPDRDEPEADLSPSGLAEIVVAFMDALGLERATIVGNDTGGAVSQMLTAAHPDRVERLVLTNCDTFEHFPPFPFNGLTPIAKAARRRLGAAGAVSLRRRAPARVRPLAKRKIDPRLVDSWLEPAATDGEIKRDLTKILRGVDKRELIAADEQLASFERPVRFAWGSDDRFFKRSHAERLAATLPDARIADVADAATFVPLDQPARVAELVAEFVAAARGQLAERASPHGGVASSTVPPATTLSTPFMWSPMPCSGIATSTTTVPASREITFAGPSEASTSCIWSLAASSRAVKRSIPSSRARAASRLQIAVPAPRPCHSSITVTAASALVPSAPRTKRATATPSPLSLSKATSASWSWWSTSVR